MSRDRKCLAIIVLFTALTSLQVFSQDKIYLSSGIKEGKIMNITKSFVSYRPPAEKSKTINVPLRSVLLLFNEKGGYLIPSKMNAKEEKSKETINTFLNQTVAYWTSDKVFKTDKSVEDGKILKEDDSGVQLSARGQLKKINKESIVVIIYKDGRHAVNTSIDVVTDVLNSQTGSYAGMVAMPVDPTLAAALTKDAGPAAATPKPSNTPDSTVTESAKPFAIDNVLSPEMKKEFEERVMMKTKLFGSYLKILCDKKNSAEEMNKTIDLAVGLFKDSAKIQTSSVNRQNYKERDVLTYLREVKRLQYDRIEIEWVEVQYYSKLELANDGSYHGIVTFQQKFTGFRDGLIVYQDVTEKHAEVILKKYTKVVEGQQKLNWDILLGDVNVVYTQKTLNN